MAKYFVKVNVTPDRANGNTNLSERCDSIIRRYGCTPTSVESYPGNGTYSCQITASRAIASQIETDLRKEFKDAEEIAVTPC